MPEIVDAPRRVRRNKGFEETHRELIETAVRLISENGAEALSIAALARAVGINRTTIYYHFDSREALLEAVTRWATGQLARGMDESLAQPERAAHINRFVLENPELIKLWIEEFVSGTDIRKSYPLWDQLAGGLQQRLDATFPGEGIDAEVYCVMLLTASIIGPRVFARTVRPDLPHEEVTARFLKELQRTLRRDGVMD